MGFLNSSTASFAWAHSYGCIHPGQQLDWKVQESLTYLFGRALGCWLGHLGSSPHGLWSCKTLDWLLSWFQGSIPSLRRQKQGLFRSAFGRRIMSFQPQSFGQAISKTSPCLRDWETDSSSFIYLFIYLFIYGCVGSSPLREGPLQLRQVGATPHRGARASWLSRPPPLRSTGSRRAGSAVAAHGPSCPAARGILPDQGPNPRPPHWQADSQPLRHQGSPILFF